MISGIYKDKETMDTGTDRKGTLPAYGKGVRFRWDPFMFSIFNRWLYTNNRPLWLKVYSNLYSAEGQYDYTSNDCGLNDCNVISSVNSILAAVKAGSGTDAQYTVDGIHIAANGCYMYRLDSETDGSGIHRGIRDLWFHCACFEGYEPLLSVGSMYDSFTDPVILLMRYAADHILGMNRGNTSADVQKVFMQTLSWILIKDEDTIRKYCNMIAHDPGIYIEGGALHDIIMGDDMGAFCSIGFSISGMSPSEKYREYIRVIEKVFPDIREDGKGAAAPEGRPEADSVRGVLEDSAAPEAGCSLDHLPDGMWDAVYRTDCRIKEIAAGLVEGFDRIPEDGDIQKKEMIARTAGELLEIRAAFQKFRKDNRDRLARALSDAEGLLAGCQGICSFKL